MVKRHVPILMSGLALGLVLVVFRSLALAQEPVSQKDADVHIDSPVVQVERQEPIRLPAGQVVSYAVSIEPVQLQIAERTTLETRMLLTSPLLPEARLDECYHAIQPVRREFKALTGQVIGEAYSITRPVSTHDSGRGNIWPAAVRVVTSTADGGSGTLRQCLENAVPGDTCTFDPGVFPPINPVTIALSSELPWIITDNLTIDASDAGVILDGSGLSSGDGFTIVGAHDVSIRGLQILYFPGNGISAGLGAVSTTIGGDRFTGSGPLGQGNLISSNGMAGVWLESNTTMSNTVRGNYIGTNVLGSAALGNALPGVVILGGAKSNIIGGNTPGACNLISGNGYDGVFIQDGGTSGNRVVGNHIGTDIAGVAPLGNRNGVVILGGATDNIIGGDTREARNLISGNRDTGVWLQEAGTSGNRVLGNYIGTNFSGTRPLANSGNGVFIGWGATNNRIGGYTDEARNLISGNGDTGVRIQNAGTMSNTVCGNYIGLDVSGTISLGNAESGVSIHDGATNNIIGGDTHEARNIISGNRGDAGVEISGVGTMGNVVLGNYIGTNVSGTVSLSNIEHGVAIYGGATNNTIGGVVSGTRNLISGNGEIGIVIWNAGTSDNQVLGNYVGTDASGTVAIPNHWGVVILDGPTDNAIGGDSPGADNLISGNTETGVRIEGSGTTNNKVLSNYIGTTASGLASLPNLYGVVIYNGAMNNIIGGIISGTCNTISGNGEDGIVIWNAAENQVRGNYVGTDPTGVSSLSNARNGVLVGSGATHNTIGISNTVAYNALAGVVISGIQTLYNTVTRNVIHNNGSLPIDLVALPSPVSPSPPTLNGFSSLDNTVEGNACPGCRVEIFANPTIVPAGTIFLDDTLADASGYFSLTLTGLPFYPYLAATATDPDGTTSEFSNGFPLVGSTLTPAAITVTVSSSATVIYTHTLTNIGWLGTDTFTLSATSNQGWLEAYQPPQVTLDSGMTATVMVTITVPDGLPGGTVDRTGVTATSGLNPQAVTTAEDVTVFEGCKIYLPLVVKEL